MGKQTFHRIKKALIILLLISFAVSLTATSVNAGSSAGNMGTTQEKSACAEKGKIMAQEKGSTAATKEKGTCTKPETGCNLDCIRSNCPECQAYILTGNTAGAIVCAQTSLNRSCNACCQYMTQEKRSTAAIKEKGTCAKLAKEHDKRKVSANAPFTEVSANAIFTKCCNPATADPGYKCDGLGCVNGQCIGLCVNKTTCCVDGFKCDGVCDRISGHCTGSCVVDNTYDCCSQMYGPGWKCNGSCLLGNCVGACVQRTP
jgi:hypothetical protein